MGQLGRRINDKVRQHKDTLTKSYRFSYNAEHARIYIQSIALLDVKVIYTERYYYQRLFKES